MNDTVEISYIEFVATPGAQITDALRDATIQALKFGKVSYLVFNHMRYEIQPYAILTNIEKGGSPQ